MVRCACNNTIFWYSFLMPTRKRGGGDREAGEEKGEKEERGRGRDWGGLRRRWEK